MTKSSFSTNRLRLPFALLSTFLFAIWGYHFGTGWPPLLMALLGALIGAAVYAIGWWVVLGLGRLLGRLSNAGLVSLVAMMVSLLVLKWVGFGWPDQIYYPGAILLVLMVTTIMASWQRTDKRIKWIGTLLPLILLGGGLFWLLGEGSDPFSETLPAIITPPGLVTLEEQGLTNPAEAGDFSITTFTYGSGNDQQRPEYASGVRFVTPSVDASLLLPEWKGKKKKWRERYWGFGVDSFPLNARVYLPEGEGPFPLVMIVHGNHSMIDYSDGGYAYLGELLASRGMITVSVDENFINGHWSGDFMGREMPARAWLLLKHLEQWQAWNTTKDHELFGKIDMDHILLAGHSRGGESVSIAAAFNRLPAYPDNALLAFDFNFNIRAVISIAPTDYRYHRQITLENLDYLSLQGSYDSDEVSFWGLRPYRRLENSEIKAGVYIHRANHGQFNSSWGRADFGGTMRWLLNTKPLLTGEEQRQAAAVFISAFAEATLKDNKAYLPLLQNAQLAGSWLPQNYYLNHFQQEGDLILQDFEEDLDLYSGKQGISIQTEHLKVWREETLLARDGGSQENNALILGWDYGAEITADSIASCTFSFPDGLGIDSLMTHLLISLAVGQIDDLPDNPTLPKEEDRKTPPTDLQLILTDSAGVSIHLKLSDYQSISPSLSAQFMKIKSLDEDMIGKEHEIQLATFSLPLTAFETQSEPIDTKKIKTIKLVFPYSTHGVLVVDDIGFGRR
jgi:hypothetical protein